MWLLLAYFKSKLYKNNNIDNNPSGDHCAEWGWIKWVTRSCYSCCVAIVLLTFKTVVLLFQVRLQAIFLFYNRSREAPWICLWVFVFNILFVLDSLVMRLKLRDKGKKFLVRSRFLFQSFLSFIFNFSEPWSFLTFAPAGLWRQRVLIFSSI